MAQRVILATMANGKSFRVTVPDGAKVTFGPWSPPGESKYGGERALAGTLRIYESAKTGASVLGVFSGVAMIRDVSLMYEEQVAREEGAVIWKSDAKGYTREEKVQRDVAWQPALGDGTDGNNNEEVF